MSSRLEIPAKTQLFRFFIFREGNLPGSPDIVSELKDLNLGWRWTSPKIMRIFGVHFLHFPQQKLSIWYINGSLQAEASHYLIGVPFEFDATKSASAKADPNRGIDFSEAQVLWLDPDRVEVPLPFAEEPRLAVIGKIGVKTWTAIVTQRGDNIRIISVRRAHPKEEKIYEQS